MNYEESYLMNTLAEIKQLVMVITSLNKKLKTRITELEIENETHKKESERLEQQLMRLQKDYEILKLAKAVKGKNDSDEAKMQIAKLMREVNQCIALVENL